MTMMDNEAYVRTDRMRYVKNTTSSRLCYLAILADVLCFVSIYSNDAGSWYYKWIIGVSIVWNLLFMLMAFLASEGVKNYQVHYCPLLYALGAIQFARVFILPLQAHQATIKISGAETLVMGNSQFIFTVLCFVVSGIALILAAIVNQRKYFILKDHLKNLEERA